MTRHHAPATRHGRGRASWPSSATRCGRASRRSGGRRCCCRASARSLFGLLAHAAQRADRRAGVRQRRRRGHLRAGHADRRARHRRRRARRRGPRRHVPLHVAVARRRVWQIVLGRWLGGAIVALVTIAPATRARGGRRRRARRAPAGGRSPRRSAASPTSPCSSPSAASPERTAVWSLAFVFLVERLLGAALTGIAQLSPTWESRAIFVGLLDDPPTPPRPRRHPRRLGRGRPPGRRHRRRRWRSPVWRMKHMRLSGATD